MDDHVVWLACLFDAFAGACVLRLGHAQVLEKLAKELMMRLDYNGHFSAEALY